MISREDIILCNNKINDSNDNSTINSIIDTYLFNRSIEIVSCNSMYVV